MFAKLGTIGFGGPAVHIAMMEEEVVKKRGWMTREKFLDLVGATNLIPGPNSTEMAMHCGYERAGVPGLIIAGCSFILPAAVITAVIGWSYQQVGTLPEVQPFILGISAAVIAVVFMAMVRLAGTALKNAGTVTLGIGSFTACLLGINEIVVIFASGAIGIVLHMARKLPGTMHCSLVPMGLAALPNSGIFTIFLKIGALLYGSGYVLYAFLDAELVRTGWITRQVLVDAVAVGQITPGPLFSSATFIGWQIGGITGAVAATAGIFLPSFLFVGLLNPLIPSLRRSPLMSSFLDGVNAASVSVIASVLLSMGLASVTVWWSVLIVGASSVLLFLFPRFNAALVIAGGALTGFLLSKVPL